MVAELLQIGELSKLEGNILRLELKDEVEIESSDIIALSEATTSMSEGIKYGLLVISGKYTTVTPEARKTAARQDLGINRIALAFVSNSLAQKLLVNFFISFNKPTTPTKLFTNQNDAKKWLKTFL